MPEIKLDMRIGLDGGYPVVVSDTADQRREFNKWQENPGLYEDKDTITSNEYRALKRILKEKFGILVEASGLSKSEGEISDDDLNLARTIVDTIQEIEDETIPDDGRRPWNTSVRQHVTQVAAFSRIMSEESGIGDPKRIEVKGLLHDLGRSVTHHPVHHLLAGRELGKTLGLAADIRRTMLAHGEAGVGPYIAVLHLKIGQNTDRTQKNY